MELWYFSPSIKEENDFFELETRLVSEYGANFHITVFVPCTTGEALPQNGRCTILPFVVGTDPLLHTALGPEFALSYEMYLAARNALEGTNDNKPDAIIFPLHNAAAYYTLLYRYLDSAFWGEYPIFVEDTFTGCDEEAPYYLLPNWWIGRQEDFCRAAASGIINLSSMPMQDTLFPAQLNKAVIELKSQVFFPTVFPFQTLRPQSLAPEVECTPLLLTIIIPFYNMGDTLPETLKSVFSVDYPMCEVLLIDDGSNQPESLKVLDKMKHLYPKIRVIRQKNHGLSYVRNRGSQLANGEYITFLDPDDMIEPDFYRRAITLLKQYENAAYVSSWFRSFGDTEIYKAYFSSSLPALLLENMQTASCVCRRNIFLAYGQNSTNMRHGFEDHEAWINMAEQGHFGINIPEPLLHYRIREGSMSASFSRDSSHHRQMKLFQVLEEKHPALYKEYSTEIYNLLICNGPSFLWAGLSNPHGVVGYIDRPISYWLEEIELARKDAKNYANSRSYKLGRFLLHFFRK